MILISNYTAAVFLCFLAMICWGSWQNVRNIVGLKWRFELFYWDFVIGIVLMALISALTLGSIGSSGRSFFADIQQSNILSILSSMAGGAIWNIGTLLLVASIAISGMSVAFPVGGGIGWLLGILINYIAQPAGNPVYLVVGSIAIIIAIIFSILSYRKLASQQQKPTLKGFLLAFAAGIAIAYFYRFVAASLDPDFTPANAGKLSPYTAVFFFSIGAFISTFIYNPFFMRRPVEGSPVTFKMYFSGSAREHYWGVIGGMIWCLGNIFSFMAANVASPAISYGLSNAAPVIAAIWGIFVWKEFKEAPKGTNLFLFLMFLCYLIGLVFIIFSRM